MAEILVKDLVEKGIEKITVNPTDKFENFIIYELIYYMNAHLEIDSSEIDGKYIKENIDDILLSDWLNGAINQEIEDFIEFHKLDINI